MVRVVPYDARWPDAFRRESLRLEALLGTAATAIHHIGSTAVPGLCSKPVLDVLVETADLERVDALEPRFSAAGYLAKGEYGIPGRRYFTRPEGTELKTHVHVFRQGSSAVARHLGFRDYLRVHSDMAAEYGALKQRLARDFERDAAAYQAGKTAFISRGDALAADGASERAGVAPWPAPQT